MTRNTSQYIVPVLLLIASGGIAGWTTYVVYKDHEVSTFKDTPLYIPLIDVVMGGLSALVFFANFFRLLGCTGEGWCNSGLGFLTMTSMFAAGILLYVETFRLSKDDQDFYKYEKRFYYNLTIGQLTYFLFYCLLLVFQLLCRMSICCGCCKSDDYYLEEDSVPLYS